MPGARPPTAHQSFRTGLASPMWRARGGCAVLVEAGRWRQGGMVPLSRPEAAAAAAARLASCADSRLVGGRRPPGSTLTHHHHRLLLSYPAPPSSWTPFSTKPDAERPEAAAEPEAASSEGPATDHEAEERVPLFMSPAPRFFRLLAGASLTQIAFWTSYSWLPPEVGGHLGYWGIVASGAFCFIARHFAMHYVWSVDAVSPVAFKFSGHTFWGNQGAERVVQVGTTQMQQTSRYIAFKVKGDTFWHLLDIKEGKFKSDEAREQLTRMFMGLRPEGLEHSTAEQGADGAEAGAGGPRRRAVGSGGRKWQGWKGKK